MGPPPALQLIVAFLCLLHAPAAQERKPPFCPCAWVESGGIWADRQHFAAIGRAVTFVANRCSCVGDQVCTRGWTNDESTLTFKWMGMPDTREYKFQMKFCYKVAPYYRRWCGHNEVAFTLMQMGTWLYLMKKVNCRCPYGVADMQSVIYESPVTPHKKGFRARYINMTCTHLRQCGDGEPCFEEPAYPDGRLRRGTMKCACHKGSFCPLYYIGGRRDAIAGEDAKNETVKYELQCVRVGP